MRTYIVTYFRHNPQLKNGGYISTCKIEAVSIASARKKARESAKAQCTEAASCWMFRRRSTADGSQGNVHSQG
mgnify:CR=1 FL=1